VAAGFPPLDSSISLTSNHNTAIGNSDTAMSSNLHEQMYLANGEFDSSDILLQEDL
jgi:hypothetical protein